MVDWKNKVDLRKEWRRARDGKLMPFQLGRLVAVKLGRFSQWDEDLDFVEIRERFNGLDVTADFDDFDNVITDLYDWADVDHRLWVATS